jgi:ABC-type Fe3+ transport system substrate-binding protein
MNSCIPITEEDILMTCGPRPHMSKRVSEHGIPVLQQGALNVYTILPCPLKVRFKQTFEAFMAEHNRTNEMPIYCPTILDGSPKTIEAQMKDAQSEDDLPEMLVTTGFHTIFSRPFKQKYLETGVYTGLTKPGFLEKMPADYQRIAKQYNIGFLAFGSWSLIFDMSVKNAGAYPTCWTDLAKPEFKDKLSIHGYHGKASGTSLLLVLKERMGEKAIEQFGQNIKNIKHFAEVIKGIDSPDPDRVAFNILPNAASVQIPSRKNAAMIEFKDGPLMAPLLMFVKKSKTEACKPLIDFFWSETFRQILEKGDFHMPDTMDWTQNYSFPSWDYLATHDFEELSAELDVEFQKGLNVVK